MRRIVDPDPRTFGELLSDLREEASYLVRREMDLARAELTEKGKAIGRHSALVAAGAVIGLLAGIALCIAVCAALFVLFALFTPIAVAIWLGPLVGAILMGLVAGALAYIGIRRLQSQHLRPDHTVDSLQENQQWIQERVT